FCGSSPTPFALKKSASVPEAAGAIVTGGGAGSVGAEMPASSGVPGVTAGCPSACGAVAPASGATVIVCVTVAGIGSGGCGDNGPAGGGGRRESAGGAT